MKRNRIHSIDIMRGLTLFLMLFVNDLYIPGVPKWMVHTAAQEDGMGLADWVFPGFLFMVGMSIPFAFMAREKKGEHTRQLLQHILIRTISLLLIGVFMVNVGSYNAELTGIHKYIWAIFVYICFFLIWNNYPSTSSRTLIFKLLKFLGIIGLAIMAFLYRSGTAENPGWMTTSWWGILGLIGWGYLVSSLIYFWLRDNLLYIALAWIFFVLINMLSQNNLLDFLSPIKPIFGIILEGNVPSIVLAGLFIGITLKQYNSDFKTLFSIILPIGILCIILGFVFRNWFIISKILGTPSWAMLCNGISILVFSLLYYLIDIKKWQRWSNVFIPAGQNSLTTYLAPNVLYYLIWYFGWNILFYKQNDMAWLAVSGSLAWAFAMVGFAALLAKLGIRLKL